MIFFFAAATFMTYFSLSPSPPPLSPLLPSPIHRELWYLADFLTALADTEDVREGLAQWASGTYRGPAGLKKRVVVREEEAYH